MCFHRFSCRSPAARWPHLRLSPAISGYLPDILPTPSSGYLQLSPDISGYLAPSYLRLSPAISGYLRISPAISGYLPAISRISCRFFLLSCCYQPCFLPKNGLDPVVSESDVFSFIYIYICWRISSHIFCAFLPARRVDFRKTETVQNVRVLREMQNRGASYENYSFWLCFL